MTLPLFRGPFCYFMIAKLRCHPPAHLIHPPDRKSIHMGDRDPGQWDTKNRIFQKQQQNKELKLLKTNAFNFKITLKPLGNRRPIELQYTVQNPSPSHAYPPYLPWSHDYFKVFGQILNIGLFTNYWIFKQVYYSMLTFINHNWRTQFPSGEVSWKKIREIFLKFPHYASITNYKRVSFKAEHLWI